MFNSNLLLLIAIAVVIFLIFNLNSNKSILNLLNSPSPSPSHKEHFNNYENFENVQNAPSEYHNSLSEENIIKNVLTKINPPQIIQNTPSFISENTLNNQFNNNLKGSPTNVGNIDTDARYAAEYGDSYNLGVNTKDPNLAKYMAQAPVEKQNLISDDLLPKQNESWFETPNVGTKVDDANLLADALFKVGVDTVGSTRKNPSYDIRGTISNPKFPISPWNNSSYEPDNNLKSLC